MNESSTLSKLSVAMIIVFSSIAIIGLCAFWYVAYLIVDTLDDADDYEFCNKNSLLYQIIEDNHGEWIKHYMVDNAEKLPAFYVGPIDSNTSVRAEYDDGMLVLLYVADPISFHDSLQGFKGYVYTIDGLPPSGSWAEEFDLTQMTDKIYCYSKGG